MPLRAHVAHAGPGDGHEPPPARPVRRAWIPIAALGLVAWLQDGNVIVVKHLASEPRRRRLGARRRWRRRRSCGWRSGWPLYLVPEAARRASERGDPRAVLVRTAALVAALAVPMVLLYAVAPKPDPPYVPAREGRRGRAAAARPEPCRSSRSPISRPSTSSPCTGSVHRAARRGGDRAAARAAGDRDELAPLALGLCAVQWCSPPG